MIQKLVYGHFDHTVRGKKKMSKEIDQLTILKKLTIRSGSYVKAVKLIGTVRGHSPNRSSFSKCVKGETSPNSYIMQCYIDDLTKALEIRDND